MPRYRFSDFTLSRRKRLLIRNGHQLPLIPRYLDLLIFLVERRRDAVHRREIFDRVWSDVIVSDSALSQAIRTLRRTLGDDPREPRFIRTVSRHGYQFTFPHLIEESDDATAVAADQDGNVVVTGYSSNGTTTTPPTRQSIERWTACCSGRNVITARRVVMTPTVR